MGRWAWGRHALLLGVVVGAIALERAAVGSAASELKPSVGPIFGMQAVPKFDEKAGKGSWGGSRDRGMAMHRDLGVRLSREGMIWRLYEPEGRGQVPHQRDFDDVVTRLEEAGIVLQFMVTETPFWASSARDKRKDDPLSYRMAPPSGLYRPIFADGTDVPGRGKRINPENPWAAFLETVVRRYKGKVRYWQCWNEPDYPKGVLTAAPGDRGRSWQGSVQDYVRLLAVMHTVVKWIDPEAQVVTGGLGYASYLQAMLDHGAGPYFDLLDFHAYGWPGSDEALKAFLSVHAAMRRVLERNGLGHKGMLCSETGYSATEPTEQADTIVKIYATTMALGLDGTVYYSNTNPSWRQMGLIDWRSMTQRTAGYWAYKNTSAALSGLSFAAKLPLPPQAVGYLFASPDRQREVAVLWAPYRKPEEALPLRWNRPGTWTRVSPEGETHPVEQGEVLRLTSRPVILDSQAGTRYARMQPNPPVARNGLALAELLASGNHGDGFHAPELAVDGDPDTQWLDAGRRAASASFAVRLAQNATIRELRLKTGPLKGVRLDLEVSQDGLRWQTVKRDVAIASWKLERVVLPAPTPARWVRLVWRPLTQGALAKAELFELEVYDEP